MAPSFLVATHRTVLAACASACTLKAGGRTRSLPGEGTAVVKLKLKGRKLRATLTEGGRVLTLNRRIRPGRRLWALASEPCGMSVGGRRAVAAGPDVPVQLALPRARRVTVVAGTDPRRTATLSLR